MWYFSEVMESQEKDNSTCSGKVICLVCEKPDSSEHRIVKNPQQKDVEHFISCVTERVTLGEVHYLPLKTTLETIRDWRTITYNAQCRGVICNASKINRLRKRSQPAPSGDDTNILSPPKRGRPSKAASTSTRPQRTQSEKKEAKQKICMFYNCDFCQSKSLDDLHQVMTPSQGHKLLVIKDLTRNDKVRVAVSGLEHELDAQAQELWYHKTCFIDAERSCKSHEEHESEILSRQLCDCEIIVYVKEALRRDEVLSMNHINEMYVDALVEKGIETDDNTRTNYKIKLRTAEIDNAVEINNPKDYKKHLKSLPNNNNKHCNKIYSKVQ